MKWTSEDIEYLYQHYHKDGWDELEKALKRDKHAIYERAKKYGLRRNETIKKAKERGYVWFDLRTGKELKPNEHIPFEYRYLLPLEEYQRFLDHKRKGVKVVTAMDMYESSKDEINILLRKYKKRS